MSCRTIFSNFRDLAFLNPISQAGRFVYSFYVFSGGFRIFHQSSQEESTFQCHNFFHDLSKPIVSEQIRFGPTYSLEIQIISNSKQRLSNYEITCFVIDPIVPQKSCGVVLMWLDAFVYPHQPENCIFQHWNVHNRHILHIPDNMILAQDAVSVLTTVSKFHFFFFVVQKSLGHKTQNQITMP